MPSVFYHPKKGHWKLEVSGTKEDAHIHAYGVVPRDIKIAVERKESCGYKNTFSGLELLAQLLVGGDR